MKKTCITLLGILSISLLTSKITYAQNDIPITNNDIVTLGRDKPEIIDVAANDVVHEGDFFYIFEQPIYGLAEIIQPGKIKYTPHPEYCGVDYIVYQYCNLQGCDQAVIRATVKCDYVKVFNGFSPNNDGHNDNFIIDGLENYPNNKLSIFNRWGNLVFEKSNYQNDFDGTWNGNLLTDGFYVYILELNDSEKSIMKGTIDIHR
ncbi:MAG: gliding motility-associated C-terminal domain-containing protein [Saprospiraceae bacterium]|nr:gliding motility-associated C-terminal domain-containing protein [Saprospiraceae bacterium]